MLFPASLSLLLLVGTTTSFAPSFILQACPTQVRLRRCGLDMSIPDSIDTLTSGLASICRLPGGVTVIKGASMVKNEDAGQSQLLRLYDIENDSACRRVRETITELNLVVEKVVPAATNSRVFATDATDEYTLPLGTEIPRLIVGDSSSGEELTLSGSDNIIAYLEDQSDVGMGDSSDDDVKEKVISVLREAGMYLAALLRIGRGINVSPAAKSKSLRPAKSLILYSYEGNQFCRLVREVLTELDLVYELRSAGKQSPRRNELAEITGGSSQCPYLIDPNTGAAMPESADIVRYLYATYADWTPPNEILQWASDVVLPLAKPLFALLTPIQAGVNGADSFQYENDIAKAKAEIEATAAENPVVVYTYDLSPFSSETIALLDGLEISYKKISLGKEWIPGLVDAGGAQKRAALLEMTGQSSLPHVFIMGKSIGGLFSGTPGLIPALEQDVLQDILNTQVAAPE